MRFSSLKLMIENGRYIYLERNKRICFLCQFNEIRDEFHINLWCLVYTDIRKKLK